MKTKHLLKNLSFAILLFLGAKLNAQVMTLDQANKKLQGNWRITKIQEDRKESKEEIEEMGKISITFSNNYLMLQNDGAGGITFYPYNLSSNPTNLYIHLLMYAVRITTLKDKNIEASFDINNVERSAVLEKTTVKVNMHDTLQKTLTNRFNITKTEEYNEGYIEQVEKPTNELVILKEGGELVYLDTVGTWKLNAKNEIEMNYGNKSLNYNIVGISDSRFAFQDLKNKKVVINWEVDRPYTVTAVDSAVSSDSSMISPIVINSILTYKPVLSDVTDKVKISASDSLVMNSDNMTFILSHSGKVYSGAYNYISEGVYNTYILKDKKYKIVASTNSSYNSETDSYTIQYVITPPKSKYALIYNEVRPIMGNDMKEMNEK